MSAQTSVHSAGSLSVYQDVPTSHTLAQEDEVTYTMYDSQSTLSSIRKNSLENSALHSDSGSEIKKFSYELPQTEMKQKSAISKRKGKFQLNLGSGKSKDSDASDVASSASEPTSNLSSKPVHSHTKPSEQNQTKKTKIQTSKNKPAFPLTGNVSKILHTSMDQLQEPRSHSNKAETRNELAPTITLSDSAKSGAFSFKSSSTNSKLSQNIKNGKIHTEIRSSLEDTLTRKIEQSRTNAKRENKTKTPTTKETVEDGSAMTVKHETSVSTKVPRASSDLHSDAVTISKSRTEEGGAKSATAEPKISEKKLVVTTETKPPVSYATDSDLMSSSTTISSSLTTLTNELSSTQTLDAKNYANMGSTVTMSDAEEVVSDSFQNITATARLREKTKRFYPTEDGSESTGGALLSSKPQEHSGRVNNTGESTLVSGKPQEERVNNNVGGTLVTREAQKETMNATGSGTLVFKEIQEETVNNVMKNKQFHSKLNQLFGQRSADGNDRPVMRKKEKSSKNAAYPVLRPSKSVPADLEAQSTPSATRDERPASYWGRSSQEEIRDTIKDGTVSTLVRDKFKNLKLTGGTMDASTLEKKRTSTTSTDGPSSAPVDPAKRFKFAVEGIDVHTVEEQAGEPEVTNTNKTTEDGDDALDIPTTRSKLKRDGFSYVLDKKLADEIIKRAGDVSANKPHEVIEEKSTEQKNAVKEVKEDTVLIEARAKLQKSDSVKGRSDEPKLPSQLLADIRANLSPNKASFKVDEHTREDVISGVNTQVSIREDVTSEVNSQVTTREDVTYVNSQVTIREDVTSEVNSQVTTREDVTSEVNSQVTTSEDVTSEINSQVTTREDVTSEVNSQVTTREDVTSEVNNQVTRREDVTSEVNSQVTRREDVTSEVNSQVTTKEDVTSEVNSQVTTKKDVTSEVKSQVALREEVTSEVKSHFSKTTDGEQTSAHAYSLCGGDTPGIIRDSQKTPPNNTQETSTVSVRSVALQATNIGTIGQTTHPQKEVESSTENSESTSQVHSTATPQNWQELSESSYSSDESISAEFTLKTTNMNEQQVTHNGFLPTAQEAEKSRYEIKRTVLSEVKTTDEVIGGSTKLEGPRERKTHHKAAQSSLIQADPGGSGKGTNVRTSVKVNTESEVKEDGVVVSHERSSETRHNQSQNMTNSHGRTSVGRGTQTPTKVQSSVTSIRQNYDLNPHGLNDDDMRSGTKHEPFRIKADAKRSTTNGSWTNPKKEFYQPQPLQIHVVDASSSNQSSCVPSPYESVSSASLSVPGGDHFSEDSQTPTPQFVYSPSHHPTYSHKPQGVGSSSARTFVFSPPSTTPGHVGSRYASRTGEHEWLEGGVQSKFSGEDSQVNDGVGDGGLRAAYDSQSHHTRTMPASTRTSGQPRRTNKPEGPLSPASMPSSNNWKYVRVDETRAGKAPRFRAQDMYVTVPDVDNNNHHRTNRHRSEERRRRTMDVPPDAGYRRARTNPRHRVSSAGSEEPLSPTAVDARLESIDKKGKQYQVTLKVNTTHAPGSNSGSLHGEHEERVENNKYRTYPPPQHAMEAYAMEEAMRKPQLHHAVYKTYHPGVDNQAGYKTQRPVTEGSSSGPHVTQVLSRNDVINDNQLQAGHVTAGTSGHKETTQLSTAPPVNNTTQHQGQLNLDCNENYLIKTVRSSSPRPINANLSLPRARSSPPDRGYMSAGETTVMDRRQKVSNYRSEEYIVVNKSESSRHNQRAPVDSTGDNGPEPRFSMMINDTMKMDYAPGDEPDGPSSERTREERTVYRERTTQPRQPPREAPRHVTEEKHITHITENVNRQPPRTSNNKHTERHVTRNREVTERHTARTDIPRQKPPVRRRSITPERQMPVIHQPISPKITTTTHVTRRYSESSESDESSEESDDPDRMKVIHGSILIKNRMDPASTGPKVVDVVQGEDSDDEDFTVEDNTNLFHGQYFQARENPLYSSQEDLRMTERKQQPPEFTKIFQKSSTKSHRATNGYDETDYKGGARKQHRRKGRPVDEDEIERSETWEETRRIQNEETREHREKVRGGKKGGKSSSSSGHFEIQKLLAGAPPDSIKQTINVEREEEEIMGPLPEKNADGSKAGRDGLLNFDTVSEKVDLGMVDGKVQVAVKVRCERIVPIRGVDDMFKKSSVIVTRLIVIDLQVTEERRRLYEHIMESSEGKSQYGGRKLNSKDTFNLYKTFMGLAEADEATQNVKVDSVVDEERRPDLASARRNIDGVRLESGDYDYVQRSRVVDPLDEPDDLMTHRAGIRTIEPDTISYMSATSEADMLY